MHSRAPGKDSAPHEQNSLRLAWAALARAVLSGWFAVTRQVGTGHAFAKEQGEGARRHLSPFNVSAPAA